MSKDQNLKTAAIEKSSHLDYFKIAISVDCVIFSYDNKELKVLLIKSDLEEFSGLYSLLGDLVRPDEDLEDASYRVLLDRTGMDDVYLEQSEEDFGDTPPVTAVPAAAAAGAPSNGGAQVFPATGEPPPAAPPPAT